MKLRIFKEKWTKVLAVYLLINIVFNLVYPLQALALTGGPSQPEVQSFAPIGTSDMVDVFSGDFSYNIPLMDVGGYPVNIAYNSGAGMDEEASWVGLGWNINLGNIGRNVRGLPDDFSGDKVERNFNVKGQQNFGLNLGADLELFGYDSKAVKEKKKIITDAAKAAKETAEQIADKVGAVGNTSNISLNLSIGIDYSNYDGVGLSFSASPAIQSGKASKHSYNASLGLSASSSSGVNVSVSGSFGQRMDDMKKGDKKLGGKLGLSVNSRAGLSRLTIGADLGFYQEKKWKIGKGRKDANQNVVNGGGSIDFSVPTYTPSQGNPTINVGGTFKGNFGLEAFGVEGAGSVEAFYSGNFLLTKHKSTSGYGYMYSHNAGSHDLQDFNRENDGPYTPNTPNLPVTNYTYDVYSVTGQGVGGTYRPFRNDFGILSDPSVESLGKAAASKDTEVDETGNSSINVSVGVDFGSAQTLKGGANVTTTVSSGTSGGWLENNGLKNKIGFKKPKANSLEEVVYFKQAGEMHVDKDPQVFQHLGGYSPIAPVMDNRFLSVYLNEKLQINGGSVYSIDAEKISRKQRRNRNQSIRIKTADEARFTALVQQIESYQENQHNLDPELGQYLNAASVSRTDHPGHHISEITVVRPDGVQYVYGLPAYNNEQKEQTFAISGSTGDCVTGLVSYSPEEDASILNKKGSDEYFDQTITPKYAHSYLLTAVISSDYVDLTGNGPTDDDLGTYTRINYSKVYADYNWRTPFQQNQANFNEGLKTNATGITSDDKASYISGKKEVWYVHSIVTKNYVAEFQVSKRKDAAAALTEHGGLDSGKSLYKLDAIRLYSKVSRMQQGKNAKPLKEVHFEYNYSLCKKIPNNNNSQSLDFNETDNQGGKLTLKRIYFTYEESNKAVLNSYRFDYSSFNPDYNIKGYDRWGNYKPNKAVSCKIDDPLSSSEFSYVEQDKALQDLYATAWNLTDIRLPSGGKIKVEYESDDYAFVQNKRAMQMFLIKGAGNTTEPIFTAGSNDEPVVVAGNTLYSGSSSNNYLYFKLQTPIKKEDGASAQAVANKYFKERYSKGIEHMYFRFLMKIDGKGESYEYVSGYTNLDQGGVIENSVQEIRGDDYYTYAYVKLKPVGLKSDEPKNNGSSVNPISKSAWQFARMHLPRVAYDQADPNANGFLQFIESAKSILTSLQQFTTGFNYNLRSKEFGKEFIVDKSWIRLHQPDYNKLGGGNRVKSIKMSDEWGAIVPGQESYAYGQVYNYQKQEVIDGKTELISSGVATYEPGLGSDENPFKQPVFYDETRLLAPDDRNYQEEPIGESFFPGATIGYSEVTVKDIPREGVTKNATGKVVHKFVTARDYPTIVTRSQPNPKRIIPRGLKLLTYKDRLAVTQGFVVELNDMHGKPLGQEVYAEGKDQPISFTRYKYKAVDKDLNTFGKKVGTVSRLDNNVNVAYKYVSGGNYIQQAEIGIDYDVIADTRMSKNMTRSMALGGNLDAFIAIIPIAVPTLWPSFSKEETEFKSAVITKVINRYSVVDEITAYDLGSTVTTKNLLYDGETGEVLLTQTVNNYDDPIYSFTYPAHWAYDGMGMAYRNEGYTLLNANLGNLNGLGNNFNIGDQLFLYNSSTDYQTVWVKSKNENSIGVINRSGVTSISSEWLKVIVIKSGRRNMHTIPVGSVVSLKNPMVDVNGDGKVDRLVFEEVLNAGVTEFTPDWKVDCNCGVNDISASDTDELAYLRVASRNWRPLRSQVYLTDRIKTTINNNTNIRKDGIFQNFNTFWNPSQTSVDDWSTDTLGWRYTTEVSYYNMHGLELENRDALNRYSAALYGYYFSLPTAVGNNSRLRELAFDSFEDYSLGTCKDDHFSYRKVSSIDTKISNQQSHTGRNSIRLGSHEKIEVRKVITPCP